jgi:hypothetical protein
MRGNQRCGLESDQGHWRPCLDLRLDRHGDGPRVAGHPGGARQWLSPEPELGPRRGDRTGFLHRNALDLHLQRLLILQRARKGEQNLPPLLTCRDMLEFATTAGAQCANLDTKVGTLTPGKEADIVMLRADRLDVWPLNNAPMAVVNLMNPGHVDTVFIAGKVMKWRGNLVGVDVARVLRLVEEARDAVVRRAGFQMNLLG